MELRLTITDEDAQLIQEMLAALDDGDADANTHGRLDMEVLARMLLEDVALAWRRPGSWEGANMSQVLASHGYAL